MRRSFVIVLAVLLALAAAGCGKAAPAETEAEIPEGMEVSLPGKTSAEESDELAAAKKMIGRDLSELIAVIGEPDERLYAPSCLGDGEDGELDYGNFTVYTYREGDSEEIRDVK